MATASTENSALLEGPDAAKSTEASQIVRVAREFGVSPLRQLREMTALRFSGPKLQTTEYYANGLYDPALSAAEKREFVGVVANRALNTRMSPPELARSNDFVGNKVLYTALLRQLGLSTTRTQAVVHSHRHFGAVRTLTNAQEVRDFLLTDAQYPLFGKPNNGSLSVGSVCVTSIEADQGKLHLGNGRSVELDQFCNEVVRAEGGGYLFQSALVQHPDMARVAGEAIGTVRIVTVIEDETPKPLYAVWKIPSPDAMSDNFWQKGSMIAAVDVQTGTVTRARIGTGPDASDIETHPVSGASFDNLHLPCWDQALQLACDAHAVFPEFGIVGFDMAITTDGPAIVECNDNPFHMLFQLANGRGIKNPDFMPVFDRVAARSAAILKQRKAAAKG
ncbi:sugar-transfer associated ATP-grasp domain-containing protein [Arenibacterium sp. CAU 1754]